MFQQCGGAWPLSVGGVICLVIVCCSAREDGAGFGVFMDTFV